MLSTLSSSPSPFQIDSAYAGPIKPSFAKEKVEIEPRFAEIDAD
jgi:hypothetical protein